MKIYHLSWEDLTEVEKELQPDNGSGKEYAGYLAIDDGVSRRVYSDACEPEDARLYRDFSWVKHELEIAYGIQMKTQSEVSHEK